MKKAFLELHLSILLAGWTGVFGKLIDLSPGIIVCWRILIAGGLLWLWCFATRRLPPVAPRDRIGIMLVGMLLMVQWTLFYASIKFSNVSIGVVTFSTVGFFTAIAEPLLTRSRIRLRDLLFSSLAILGIALIFQFDARYRLGIALGLLSAAGAASLAVFFRMYRARYDSVSVMRWQLAGGLAAVVLSLPAYFLFLPETRFIPGPVDFGYLLVFSTVCTIGMYLLQIQALEKISAFTVNLSYNLEPIYSIIIAMVLFEEARELGLSFYAGLSLIALSVALQTLAVLKAQKRLAGPRAGGKEDHPAE